MRAPTRRGGPVCDFERTVTSMVDIVFQLLVFFVLASGGRMAEQTLATSLSAGTVSTPETRQRDERLAELWIHIKRDAAQNATVIELNGHRRVDSRTLHAALAGVARAAPDGSVILDVAGEVPLGDVLFVYDTCRAAKFRSINFAASPEEVASRNTQ